MTPTIVQVACMEADGVHYGPNGAGAVYDEGSPPLYRYRLWRTWKPDLPVALFVMLNPSTATHLKLDNTLRRCKVFAVDWALGGFEVVNLFAWRATDPEDMKGAEDPIGPANDAIVLERAQEVTKAGGLIVAGWGRHGSFRSRGLDMRAKLRQLNIKLHYLRLTESGEPGHPLYLPKETKPQEWL